MTTYPHTPYLLSVLIVLLKLLILTFAFADSPVTTRQANSNATFITKHKMLELGENELGLHIEVDPEWHTYWLNPGDSASPPTFDFEFPEGIRLVRVDYPTPFRYKLGPLYSFGYEKETLFRFTIEVVDKTVLEKPFQISLDTEWLVCKEECIPGIYKFTLDFPPSVQIVQEINEIFGRFASSYPDPNQIEQGVYLTHADDIQISGLKGEIEDLYPVDNGYASNKPTVSMMGPPRVG